MTDGNLSFGIFLAPFHTTDENPTAAIQRDLELIELLDELGYEHAWIGEHHSGGYQIIASPEVFIASAAERTQRIRLGTGVSSLPYHHPLILADRIMQLDHMTRGRIQFGVGPGALPADAFMMGIDPHKQLDMMLEAIEVLVPLLRGEVVTRKTDWFELNQARLQLMPYQRDGIPMAVASQVSPAGARAAGSFGLDLLSISATSAGGFNGLAPNWEIYERKAREHDQIVDRSKWSLVGPVHIARTRKQAFKNVEFGIGKWVKYFSEVVAMSLAPGDSKSAARALVDSGFAVIGTAKDAIEQLQRLQEQSGGFGTFLHMAHNWADWRATRESYELFARYVVPVFQSSNSNRKASYKWASRNYESMIRVATEAKDQVEVLNEEMGENQAPVPGKEIEKNQAEVSSKEIEKNQNELVSATQASENQGR